MTEEVIHDNIFGCNSCNSIFSCNTKGSTIESGCSCYKITQTINPDSTFIDFIKSLEKNKFFLDISGKYGILSIISYCFSNLYEDSYKKIITDIMKALYYLPCDYQIYVAASMFYSRTRINIFLSLKRSMKKQLKINMRDTDIILIKECSVTLRNIIILTDNRQIKRQIAFIIRFINNCTNYLK